MRPRNESSPCLFVLFLLAALLVTGSAAPAARAQEQGGGGGGTAAASRVADPSAPRGGWVELHRIRIVNRTDGPIQVSTDGGASWRLIGRVLYPATTVPQGYLAASYADPGTVAAVAVHGIRIRVSEPNETLRQPLVLSIDPREYSGREPNKGYGGHRPGAGGIYTDIPAGHSLFRELAPMVGNPILVQSESGRLFRLPPTFKPSGQGETLIIPVQVPRNSLTSVTFENKVGGAVEVTFADGTKQRVTSVVKPVKGVGRFDGTAYTGVGRINTAHTGVITVSTAPVDAKQPEGIGRERRGGFQISPAWHNARTEEASAPMVLTLGTPDAERKRELEGMPPLFRDLVPLALGDKPDEAGIVDVAIDGGPWEPMPTIVGLQLDALTGPGLTRVWKTQGIKRTAKQGVTAFRLRLPRLLPGWSQLAAVKAAEAYHAVRLAAARDGKIPLVQGTLTINPNPTNAENVSYVRLLIDGQARAFTNIAPFTLTWDTTRVPDGEYLVEAEALSSGGSVIATNRRRVFVLNNPPPAPVRSADVK